MSLEATDKLGKTLGGLNTEQDSIKENISPDESEGQDVIFAKDTFGHGVAGTITKKNYLTDVFIIDHPVYGDINSATLRIDGGWALQDGLILNHALEDTTYSDSSDNGFDGTIHNPGTPIITTGLLGNAVFFQSGSNQFIQLDDYQDTIFNGSNPWTINVWGKTALTSSLGYLFWRSDDLPSIRFNTSSVYFMTDGNLGQSFNVPVDYDDDEWRMYTFTYDGTTAKGFVNAALVGSDTISMSTGTSKPIRIGCDGVVGREWKGAIDELSIYDRVITQDEIDSLYNSGSGVIHPFHEVVHTF